MSGSDKLLLRKRAIIETVNDELMNIAQVEHSRHRCFDNFMVNLLGALAAYCFFPKKPTIRVEPVDCMNDRQLTLFLSIFVELTLIILFKVIFFMKQMLITGQPSFLIRPIAQGLESHCACRVFGTLNFGL